MCWSFWLVTHGYPIYLKLGKSHVHTCLLQSSNQNKNKNRKQAPSTRIIPRKICVNTRSHLWLQKICKKNRRFARVSRTKSSINLVILARISPNFLFCLGSCTLRVRLWGYIQGRGGGHSSHFLLFYIVFMSTILNRDRNYVCVLWIFISKNKFKKT